MQLLEDGLLMGEISERFGVSRNLLTRTIAAWHIERGLPVPDGRTRRKRLSISRCPYSDDIAPTRDIDGVARSE